MARFPNKLGHTGEVGSEKRHGALRLANATEAAAQSSTKLAVSPARVAASMPAASATVAGKVELATNAEAQARSSSALAITPANLAAEGFLQYKDTTITAAQVKALATTPIELVAAPGAGAAIMFMGALFKLNYGSEVFAESGDNLGIKYTNASGVQVSATVEMTGFIDQSADTYTRTIPANDAIVAAAAAENQALVLDNLGSNITGNASNDSTLGVRVYYLVQSL